jgi:2,3-bisphosphoglycerate-dependent phosphoglycerate mutase
MPRRKLVLIRHAQPQVMPGTPASRWELSAAGRESCQNLADQLKPYLPATLVSSQEPKARQTAGLIGRALGLGVESAAGLQEHARENIPFFSNRADFLTSVVRMLKNPDNQVLGEETASRALARFDRAVRRAAERWPGKNLLISTHGTVLALFVAHYNPVPIVEFWRNLKMPDHVPLSFPDFRLLSSD